MHIFLIILLMKFCSCLKKKNKRKRKRRIFLCLENCGSPSRDLEFQRKSIPGKGLNPLPRGLFKENNSVVFSLENILSTAVTDLMLPFICLGWILYDYICLHY